MITKSSPAKVNLQLRVLGKRADGYHDILSLMQRISLGDEMSFAPTGCGILLHCPDSPLPENEENIVYRAARLFLSRVAQPKGVWITLRKNIPIAAGLGGGSSNAATTLLALNELSPTPLDRQALLDMAATLGADVPFFIFGKTAWATGIGEVLTEAPPLPPLWLVLINPGFAVSTKRVYEALNFGLTKERLSYIVPRIYTVEDVIRGLTNDLERVTLSFHPELGHLKHLLLNNGALGALMSGSGPTVFGIFADEAAALAAEGDLSRLNRWSVFRARTL
jgi:4-diphosphocytidyl-2-C-methyl-D-erythritol kinase